VNRHHVLVVDDDLEIRDGLIDLLEDHNCDATGADNGAKALAYLKSADPLPCLIFLDLMMPVMDGRTFREEQMKEPRLAGIPVIVLSAYRDVQADAEELKVASFLKKPPKLEDLMSLVALHC
jgi:CheY-like chemotaxis protein